MIERMFWECKGNKTGQSMKPYPVPPPDWPAHHKGVDVMLGQGCWICTSTGLGLGPYSTSTAQRLTRFPLMVGRIASHHEGRRALWPCVFSRPEPLCTASLRRHRRHVYR